MANLKEEKEKLEQLEVENQKIINDKKKVIDDIEQLEAQASMKQLLKDLEDQRIADAKLKEVQAAETDEDRIARQMELQRIEQRQLNETLKATAEYDLENLLKAVKNTEKRIKDLNDKINNNN